VGNTAAPTSASAPTSTPGLQRTRAALAAVADVVLLLGRDGGHVSACCAAAGSTGGDKRRRSGCCRRRGTRRSAHASPRSRRRSRAMVNDRLLPIVRRSQCSVNASTHAPTLAQDADGTVVVVVVVFIVIIALQLCVALLLSSCCRRFRGGRLGRSTPTTVNIGVVANTGIYLLPDAAPPSPLRLLLHAVVAVRRRWRRCPVSCCNVLLCVRRDGMMRPCIGLKGRTSKLFHRGSSS